MEWSNIPVPIFAALGALLAALVTGFFSFLNLVSAKENKVSEFRLAWIDGMRVEVADYTCAVQELLRLEESRVSQNLSATDLEWLASSRSAYNNAVTSLTKIQLRLNPNHLDKNSTSLEADLMAAIREGREHFNAADFEKSIQSCELIRLKAALLLKDTWNLVKLGEAGYRRIRRYAQNTIIGGLFFVFFAALAALFFGYKTTMQSSSSVSSASSASLASLASLAPSAPSASSAIAATPATPKVPVQRASAQVAGQSGK